MTGVLLFNSCKEEKEIQQKIENHFIEGKTIFKNKYNVYNVYYVDSLILVKNIPSKENSVFSVYKNDQNFTHILDFGLNGDGPEEFENQVYYTYQFEKKLNGIKFWVYEMNKNKYSKIDLTKSIEAKKTIIDEVIRLKPGLSLKEMFYIDEGRIVGNQDNLALKMKRLKFYSSLSNSVIKDIDIGTDIVNPRKNDMDYTQQSYNPLFLSTLRYSKSKGKLVSAMVSQDKIDVFNLEGELVKSIINSENKIRDVDEFNKNIKAYNSDLFLGNEYIYVLYSGDSMVDYFENSTPTKIKIYDWNYQIKYVFEMKESLNFFTVNEKSKKIIGVSLTQEKIVEYDLEKLLKE